MKQLTNAFQVQEPRLQARASLQWLEHSRDSEVSSHCRIGFALPSLPTLLIILTKSMIRPSRIERFRLRKTPEQTDRALRVLIQDAWNHVPGIRRRFEQAGLRPDPIRTARDLIRLPVTDRTSFDPRNLQDHLRNGTDGRRCSVCMTSGTTGQRLSVYMTQPEAFFRRLILLLAIRKNAHVTFPFSILDVGTDTWSDRGTKWYGVGRVTRISRLLPLDEQVEQLVCASPDVITGMPSCLELLAERLHERGETPHQPLLVVSRGEQLHTAARKLLAEVFGCRVVDYYNCEEVGNIAWECPQDQELLHVQTNACILEVVDEDGLPMEPGMMGRVVVTNLFNHTMPFIRHDLGDRAAMKPPRSGACTCGYHGQSLSPIDGREGDFFWRQDGQRVSPLVIITLVNNAVLRLEQRQGDFVRRYQVVQEATGQIRVLLATPSPVPEDITSEIANAMERCGLGIECAVERVVGIPSELSGKFRRIISHMDKRS